FGVARYDPGSATALTSSVSPSLYGQPVTFTVTVTAGGSPVPGVRVAVADGAAAIGSVLTDGSGRGTLTTAALPAGVHPLTASFGGQPGISGSTANLTQTVTPAPLTVRADDKSRGYGQPNPTLTASYTGFVLGQGAEVLTGTLTLSTTATLASGA